MEKSKNKVLIIAVVILSILVICLSGFVIYDKVLKKENNIENKSPESVKCSDCVTKIDYKDIRTKKEYNIVINDTVKKLVIKDLNDDADSQVVVVDNKETVKAGGLRYIDAIYLIDEELIMIVVGGSDIRSLEYYFYDRDLQPLEVDMTLDSKYGGEMVATTGDDITVNGSVIKIVASRETHGSALVLNNGESVNLCGPNGTFLATKYKGEVLSAEYEIKYLSNGQFSKPERTKIISYVDENVCK